MPAPTISPLSPVSYTEGGVPAHIADGISISGGYGYPRGSITFGVSGGDATEQLVLTSAGGDVNAPGAISIVGDEVFLGIGAGVPTLIGTVDETENGQGGQPLTIHFVGQTTSVFTDPSFENNDPTLGWAAEWTPITEQVKLDGLSQIGGHPTPNDGQVPGGSPGDDPDMNDPLDFTVTVAAGGDDASHGNQGLRLLSDSPDGPGQNTDPFGVVHGPAVISKEFAADQGDILSFDWKAENGEDAYDAFGYLLNADTGQTVVCLNVTGATSSSVTNWAKTSVVVPEGGNWQFVFISGSHDATGGRATGGSLYIDNFAVERSSVTDDVLETIASQVTYENTSDAPPDSRTVTVTVTDGAGNESDPAEAAVTIADTNDAPSGSVTVTGEAEQGEVLTATNDIADADGPDPVDVAYRWQRQDDQGNWRDINGAAGETYTLTQDDVDHAIRAVASYTDGFDNLEQVASDPTTAVANVNDTPVAACDSFNVVEDTETILDVLANDLDIDGDTRTIIAINGAAITVGTPVDLVGGSLALNGDGQLVFTPDAEFNGSISFDYTIEDGHGGTSEATAEVTVTAENDTPVATGDSFTAVADGTSIELGLLANDSDADGDSPRIVQIEGYAIAEGESVEVNGGLVSMDQDGRLFFTASITFDGATQFTYTIDDDHGGTTAGTISGTVTGVEAWSEFGDDLDAILPEHGAEQPDYINNLLYIASVVSPGAFNLADGNEGTQLGYHAGLGYDLTPDAATPAIDLLVRSLATLIAAQESSDAPDLLAESGNGWTSATNQSLLFQSKLAEDGDIHIDFLSGDAQFSDAASLGWSRQLAQMVLSEDFSEDRIMQFDGLAQGALYQATLGQGEQLSVSIGGEQAGAPQAALSNGFGMADFTTADGNSAVEVARAVAVAATVDGSDEQTAIVRMRQGGVFNLELQFYEVDDFTGAIGGLLPGDAGYAAAAAARAYQTADGATWLSGGGYGKYSEGALVGIDHDDLIAMQLSNGTEEFFAFAQANEMVAGEYVGHLWSYGLNTWGWEDAAGGGDRDFNDLIVQLDFTSAHELI